MRPCSRKLQKAVANNVVARGRFRTEMPLHGTQTVAPIKLTSALVKSLSAKMDSSVLAVGRGGISVGASNSSWSTASWTSSLVLCPHVTQKVVPCGIGALQVGHSRDRRVVMRLPPT